MKGLRPWVVLAFAAPLSAATWTVARSPHFEVWSNASPETARTLDSGLERLYSFFVRQIGISPRGTVRVVSFATPEEYDQYRIRTGSAGYSLTGPGGEWIVLHGSAPNLQIAGHEFAHLLIHSSGWTLPEWLAEGVSEVVSSVQFGGNYSFIGGELKGRSSPLKTDRWMTMAELFSFSLKGPEQRREPLFYAQSWAVAEMLIASPAYGPSFPAFLSMIGKGSGSAAAIQGVYGMGPEELLFQVRERRARGPTPLPLPPVAEVPQIRLETASGFAARRALADLRYAAGDLAGAESEYRELAAENQRAAEIPAALGLIALDRKDTARAMREWRKALDLGIRDADLCYRYATIGEDRGLTQEQVRDALERAIALRPQFDEAHFRLGLMDKNASRAAEAVAHFRAMSPPAPDRAWRYYTSLADALLDLGQRVEAKEAAARAAEYAANDEERSRASAIEWYADTELSVEMVSDAQGKLQFRTVRVPVKAPPKNPFIEAGEKALSAQGRLESVECEGERLAIRVATARESLLLVIPDPSRVQIRNGGGEKFEFVCGPQQGRPVLVEYTDGTMVLRGLELR